MKQAVALLTLAGTLFFYSCGGSGEKDLNEDPTGNERGTPGTGTDEVGTGQEPEKSNSTSDTNPPVVPSDSVAPSSDPR
jgi:hypothetical protein